MAASVSSTYTVSHGFRFWIYAYNHALTNVDTSAINGWIPRASTILSLKTNDDRHTLRTNDKGRYGCDRCDRHYCTTVHHECCLMTLTRDEVTRQCSSRKAAALFFFYIIPNADDFTFWQLITYTITSTDHHSITKDLGAHAQTPQTQSAPGAPTPTARSSRSMPCTSRGRRCRMRSVRLCHQMLQCTLIALCVSLVSLL